MNWKNGSCEINLSHARGCCFLRSNGGPFHLRGRHGYQRVNERRRDINLPIAHNELRLLLPKFLPPEGTPVPLQSLSRTLRHKLGLSVAPTVPAKRGGISESGDAAMSPQMRHEQSTREILIHIVPSSNPTLRRECGTLRRGVLPRRCIIVRLQQTLLTG